MAVTTIKDGFAGGSDNQLKVNADGSINVVGGGSSSGGLTDAQLRATPVPVTVSSGATGAPVIQYNAVTSVALGATSTVISYTVPTGKTFTLQKVLFSSDCLSVWVLQVTGATTALGRTTYMSLARPEARRKRDPGATDEVDDAGRDR